MKKKIVWSVILLAIIVAVGFVGFNLWKNTKNKVEQKSQLQVEAQQPQPQVQSQPAATLDSEESKTIQAQAEKDCSAKNLPADAKQACLSGVYMRYSAERKNVGACDLIADENQKKICVENGHMTEALASESGPNPDACQKIEDPARKESCANEAYYFSAMKNPQMAKELCGKITNAMKDSCLEKFAK